MNFEEFNRDKDGIIYKYPERTCLKCKKYPCFRGQSNLSCDFAKYGCVSWVANDCYTCSINNLQK